LRSGGLLRGFSGKKKTRVKPLVAASFVELHLPKTTLIE